MRKENSSLAPSPIEIAWKARVQFEKLCHQESGLWQRVITASLARAVFVCCTISLQEKALEFLQET
jgi:hypothetical protein